MRKIEIYAYRLSNEANLGSLELTGHIPPGNHEYEDFKVQLNASFDSGITRYDAFIPYATSYLTVSPKTFRPSDSEYTTDGH